MAQDELILLERVFLRIGSATTDEELQNNLGKFLPPVLLKLSSQQDGVRKKVMELLVHINKRIKTRPTVQLPVEALLLQYQDPSATSFIVNFTIIYIKLGFPRMEISKQADLVPSILNCLDGKPQSHQDSLMLLIVRVLNHINYPKDVEKCKAQFNLIEKPHVSRMLLSFMLDVLFLPYGVSPPSKSNSSANQSHAPPGLSEQSFKRVTGDSPMKPEELEDAKLGILKMLGRGVFSDEEIICHLIISSADTRFNVVNEADMLLKRISGDFNWNQPSLVCRLYMIFLGTVITKDKQSMNQDQRRTAASTRIRLKLLPYFYKSKEAANQMPTCIQVIFDCWYGSNTNGKLKVMAVNFVQYVILICSEAKLSPVSTILLSGLVKLIADSKEDSTLRSLAYLAVGRLGLKIPSVITKDLSLLQTFLDALPQEENEVQSSLQEALYTMSPAFRTVSSEYIPLLESLIAIAMDKPESKLRLLGVQYCWTIFLPSHIPSRYLLLLASGDREEMVASEAVKVLEQYPTTYMKMCDANNSDPYYIKGNAYPNFADMVIYISGNATQRMNKNRTFNYGAKKLPFNIIMYAEMCTYLHCCLAYCTGLPVTDNMSFEGSGSVLQEYILKLCELEADPVSRYVDLLENYLSLSPAESAIRSLLELVLVIPEKLAVRYQDKLKWIENLLYSGKEDIRYLASRLYAIVLVYKNHDSKLHNALLKLIDNVSNKKLECSHGSLLALGYTVGDKCASESGFTSESAFRNVIDVIVDSLNSDNSCLVGAACTALGVIVKHASLPYEDGGLEAVDVENSKTKFKVITKLLSIFKSKANNKLREKALMTLSFIGIGDIGLSHRKFAIEQILSTAADLGDIDLQLESGEALVNLALGPLSPANRNLMMTSESDFIPPPVSFSLTELDWVVQELLENYCVKTNPQIKQACCIWMLSLLKVSSKYKPVQDRILEFQQAFLNMLDDPNDLILDGASKGIALIYESCSQEDKDRLIDTLTSTLSSGHKVVPKVTDNTPLFEEGTLGKDPSGGKLTTYKELCSLASDLNKPDLIYKFLHIANHNALWNSKKGAAFGFSRIAQLTGMQLEPYMAKIVPRLFRYKFDPHFETQKSMKNIWDSMVSDSQKTVTKYYEEILAECVSHLEDNHWRVREASCVAVNELLSVCIVDKTIPHLATLWTSLFRVQDDIKESVRNAAEATLRKLSNLCVSVCNDGIIAGSKVLEIIIPILIHNGIRSNVSEVRSISVQTILKVSLKAKLLLKPHVGVLIPGLLENLTLIEPQQLNYVSTRLGTDTATQDKFDNARIVAIKGSCLFKAINHSVQYVDEDSMKDMVPALLELLKGHVGIPTRAGIAHVVVGLVRGNKEVVRPYAGKIVGVFVNGLSDRCSPLRKVFAVTIGELAKLLKESSFVKLGEKLTGWFVDKNDDDTDESLAIVVKAIICMSFDTLSMHACWSLPVAFLGMHMPTMKDGPDKAQNREIWEGVWSDGVSGTEYGVQLYLAEIIALCERVMGTTFWNKKMMASAALGTVGRTLKLKFVNPQLLISARLLITVLEGRTWEGKEKVFISLCDICINCSDNIKKIPPEEHILEDLQNCFMRECKKENNTFYRSVILAAVGSAIQALGLNCFEDLYNLLMPILEKYMSATENKGEDKDEREGNADLLVPCLKCIGAIWPDNQIVEERYYITFLEFLNSSFTKVTRKMQLVIMETLNVYVNKLWLLKADVTLETESQKALFTLLWKLLYSALSVPKYPSLRKECINVLMKLQPAVTSHRDFVVLQAQDLVIKLKEIHSDCPAEGKQDVLDVLNMFES